MGTEIPLPEGEKAEETTDEAKIQEIRKQLRDTNEGVEEVTLLVDEKFNTEDQKEIHDAIELMLDVHIDQKDRPDGSPYVSHPLNVASRVMAMSGGIDKELLIAALLHDSVEDQADKLSSLRQDSSGNNDQEKALSFIQNKYGERVKNIVSHLSNPDFDNILERQGIHKDNPQYIAMKNELYAKHVAEAIEDIDVLRIKLADFAENGLNLSALPTETDSQREQKNKFIKKYTPVMKIFLDRLARDGLFPEYQVKLKTEYDNNIKERRNMRSEIPGNNDYSLEEPQRQKDFLESSEAAQSYTLNEEEQKLASERITLDNGMRMAWLNADTAEYKALQERKDEIDKRLMPKEQAWKDRMNDFDENFRNRP